MRIDPQKFPRIATILYGMAMALILVGSVFQIRPLGYVALFLIVAMFGLLAVGLCMIKLSEKRARKLVHRIKDPDVTH
jgi:hypothetical protein